MPWDGVHGPRAASFEGRPVVAYTDTTRTDYIDMEGTMTAALTARIDTPEYLARILAMEAVYWALGIHDPEITPVYKVVQQKAAWAVLSFRAIKAGDSGLAAAEQTTGIRLEGPRRYFFEVYRWGKVTKIPTIRTLYVEMLERRCLCFGEYGVDASRRGVMDGGPVDADAVVVGGGPAGPHRDRLCDRGLSVVLCERELRGRDRPGETLIPGPSRYSGSSESRIGSLTRSAPATQASGSSGAARVASKPSVAMQADLRRIPGLARHSMPCCCAGRRARGGCATTLRGQGPADQRQQVAGSHDGGADYRAGHRRRQGHVALAWSRLT